MFLYCWCALYYKLFFECVYRIRGILCIHEHIQSLFLNIFWKMSQMCEQFPYDLFVMFCDFGGFAGSYMVPPTPSPASMSKFLSGGTNMENNCFWMIFVILMKKESLKMVIQLLHVRAWSGLALQNASTLFHIVWPVSILKVAHQTPLIYFSFSSHFPLMWPVCVCFCRLFFMHIPTA